MEHVTSEDGVELALHDMGGSGDPLLIVHATGFASLVYQPIADALVNNYRVFGIDLRGQGDSERPRGGRYNWADFGLDVIAAYRSIRARTSPSTPIYGFGHSCGAQALLRAEILEPGSFSKLFLYEPIVAPPELEGQQDVPSPLAELTLRRRSSFPTISAALENFKSKPPISSFRSDARLAYVSACLGEMPDGEAVLKCRKEDEAAIYSSMAQIDTYSRLPELAVECVIASGEASDTFSSSYMETLALRLQNGSYRLIPATDHFGPMVDPDLFATLISQELTP